MLPIPHGEEGDGDKLRLFYVNRCVLERAMKLPDILPSMSKLYLNRIVGSFLKDVKLATEDEMRQVILKNIDEFQNVERVRKNLDFTEDELNIDVLNELIVICLMEADGYLATYSQLTNDVESLESRIVADSKDDGYIESSIPADAGRIYSAVLEAAWDKDESLNSHEKNVLEVLRKQLGLTRRQHRLIESRIERFPQKGNKLHTHRHIDDALKSLQTKGILLRFKTDEEFFAIPDEIARVVRYEVGGELKASGYGALLDVLKVEQLRRVLSHRRLHSSGTKSALVDRIQRYDILPSETLEVLSTSELSDLLRGLPGARVSGTKNSQIHTIIDYYEALSTSETSDPTDERARFYEWFEELANRDYKTLRANKVIAKDIDVEHYFEDATRYLFEKKMGIEVLSMDGSKHADGRLKHNAALPVLGCVVSGV